MRSIYKQYADMNPEQLRQEEVRLQAMLNGPEDTGNVIQLVALVRKLQNPSVEKDASGVWQWAKSAA